MSIALRWSGPISIAAALLMASVSIAPAEAVVRAEDEAGIRWAVAPAPAADGGARQVLLIDAQPGETLSDTVDVSNLGASALTLDVYATDALNTESGDFTLLPASEPPQDAGTWISLDAGRVEVAPATAVRIPITISVPDDATPGDHAAGIVASRFVAGPAGGSGLAVDQRVGTRVFVRVAGALAPGFELTISGVDYNPWLFPVANPAARVDYEIRNTGNVALGGDLGGRLTGPFGLPLGGGPSAPVPLVLPGQSVHGTLSSSDALPIGLLDAAVTLTSDTETPFGTVDAVIVETSQRVPAVPWVVVVILLAGVAALVVRGVRRRRRRRSTAGAPADAAAPAAAAPADAADPVGEVAEAAPDSVDRTGGDLLDDPAAADRVH
ncbi:hypothetical protein FLP10_07060 [Agromyces intestinalis]|uniref:DUF916 domain-containing protein n=1 Tax=Agromyces intestinalis TaxID=2592652 RepID=A0A5C1YHG8_9MICO|nr:hypothetical protein [Agromyces intestinalis]QEO14202.1 hypothetical protein FLP10_07060 [Agromyces intestinalis]